MNKIRDLYPYCLAAFLFFIIFPLGIFGFTHLYILVSLTSVLFALLQFKSLKSAVSSKQLLYFLSFPFFIFASYLWAFQPAYTVNWAFCFMSVYLFVLVFPFEKMRHFWFTFLEWIFFGMLLYIIINNYIHLDSDFQLNIELPYLSKNMNYITSFLVVLLPFVIKKDQLVVNSLKLVLVAGILLISTSKGVAIIFILFVLGYFISCMSRFISAPFLWIFIFFIVLIALFSYNFSHLFTSDVRYPKMLASIKMWMDHPIIGVGMGNSHIHLPNYIEVVGIQQVTFIPAQIWDHNWYTYILSQLGLVGLLFFAVPFFKSIIDNRKSLNFENISILSMCIFGLTLIFYPIVINHELNFSGLFLLTLFNARYVLIETSNHRSNKLIWTFFLILGILSSVFFISYYLNDKAIRKSLIKNENVFEEIHREDWKISHGFENNLPKSLHYLSARHSILNGKLDQAKRYLKLSLNENPNDPSSLLHYLILSEVQDSLINQDVEKINFLIEKYPKLSYSKIKKFENFYKSGSCQEYKSAMESSHEYKDSYGFFDYYLIKYFTGLCAVRHLNLNEEQIAKLEQYRISKDTILNRYYSDLLDIFLHSFTNLEPNRYLPIKRKMVNSIQLDEFYGGILDYEQFKTYLHSKEAHLKNSLAYLHLKNLRYMERDKFLALYMDYHVKAKMNAIYSKQKGLTKVRTDSLKMAIYQLEGEKIKAFSSILKGDDFKTFILNENRGELDWLVRKMNEKIFLSTPTRLKLRAAASDFVYSKALLRSDDAKPEQYDVHTQDFHNHLAKILDTKELEVYQNQLARYFER